MSDLNATTAAAPAPTAAPESFPLVAPAATAPKARPKPGSAPKAAPKAKATTKAAPKGKTKAAAKTSPKAPAAKKAAEPKVDVKDGLRGPQVRILAYLKGQTKPVARKQIAEKAPCDVANCVELIGHNDEAARKANDVKHFPSLISLGLVKIVKAPEDASGTHYEITAKGRQKLDKCVGLGWKK
jgi:hypothetical protein